METPRNVPERSGMPARVIVPIDFIVSVLRTQDLLALRFEFVNLKLITGGDLGPRLERKDPSVDACVIVHFPPQNIAEEAFFEAQEDEKKSDNEPAPPEGSPVDPAGSEALPTPPVGARIAGPSRLAFKVPAAMTSIPYTIESLLTWTGFEQKVTTTALPTPQDRQLDQPRIIIVAPPEIHEPEDDETAIEAPWRVILSPNKHAAWAHVTGPVEHNGRVELWHTRLGVQKGDGTADEVAEFQRTVRAVWTPGYDENVVPQENAPPFVPATVDNPFRHSLTPLYRWNVVRLTADYTISDYEPIPMKVDRLMLSSLGAWLNIRGAWPVPLPLDDQNDTANSLVVEEWRHRAAMGRDTYVRVVIAGYLMPLGHRASRVVITERKFQKITTGPQTGKIAAFLRQRTYVIVREPLKTYPAPGQEYAGREFPFKSVRITTLVTPNLDKPESDSLANLGVEAFWMNVGGQPFQFHLIGEDADGQRTEFTAPLAFVRGDRAINEGLIAPVRTAYNLASTLARREREMRGQKIAYAPSTPAVNGKPKRPGDTAHETVKVTLGVRPPASGAIPPHGQPRFYPRVAQAEIRLQAAEQAAGKPVPGAIVQYPQAYLDGAFAGDNKGALYLKMKDPKPLGFATDKSGGVAAPNLSIGGLSRMIGPVGGAVDTFTAGDFKPADFFQGASAKILGGIEIFEVIQDVLSFTAGDEQKIPKLTTRTIYPNGDQSKLPEALETKLSWKPLVKDAPLGVLHFKNAPDKSLALDATLLTKLQAGGEPTFEILGELTNFDLNLFGTGAAHFITVKFKKLSFSAKTGKKANVDVDIEDVTFHGALSLINELQDYLKSSGSGPSIDIKPTGITAGISIGLPTIAVGVFSLQNIAIGVGLNIPFDGTPVRLRFNFCERENPFVLTVSIFGGGGFVGLAVGADGVEMVEMSLEFGGNIAIDIGVASGGVYLMAGVYLKVESGDVTLTGYVRLGGELEVLGIITISCEFYMGLTYESVGDKVYGQASLTVEVEVLFFSASVSMSVERQFAGSTHAFKFTDLVPLQADWNAYAEAFA